MDCYWVGTVPNLNPRTLLLTFLSIRRNPPSCVIFLIFCLAKLNRLGLAQENLSLLVCIPESKLQRFLKLLGLSMPTSREDGPPQPGLNPGSNNSG